jgi:hypothetical protein
VVPDCGTSGSCRHPFCQSPREAVAPSGASRSCNERMGILKFAGHGPWCGLWLVGSAGRGRCQAAWPAGPGRCPAACSVSPVPPGGATGPPAW